MNSGHSFALRLWISRCTSTALCIGLLLFAWSTGFAAYGQWAHAAQAFTVATVVSVTALAVSWKNLP